MLSLKKKIKANQRELKLLKASVDSQSTIINKDSVTIDTTKFLERHSLNTKIENKLFNTNQDGYATVNQSLESIQPLQEE